MREKQLQVSSEVMGMYKQKLNNALLQVFQNGQEPIQDPSLMQQTEDLINDIEKSFVSEYEIASQNIIENFKQSRVVDFDSKREKIARSLFVSGTVYYKTYKDENFVNFEVLDPYNVFIDKNPNKRFYKLA